MGMKLYYSPMSSSTRVHWALEELGVPYDKHKVDIKGGEHKTPAYLALNPNGKVPLMEIDGQPVFESLAMLLHLADSYGVEKGLFPKPGAERLTAYKWMSWGSVTLNEAMMRLLRNTSDRFPADEKNAAAGAAGKRDVEACLAIMDAALAGKEYFLGTFSLVDVSLATWMPFIGRLGVDLAKFANLNAWSGRCMGRPALGRAMMM